MEAGTEDGDERGSLRRVRRAARGLGWLGRNEPGLLAALLCVSLALWGAIALGGEVLEGDTRAFDRSVLLALRTPGDPAHPLGPRWLEAAVRDVTALGSLSVLSLLVLFVAGYLLLRGARRACLLMLAAVVGGAAMGGALKGLFGRPRPELVPHGAYVVSSSFPSGHSMVATVTYMTLAVMLAGIEPRRRVRIYLLAVALVLSVLIGVSRVYLGVHWPTDVVAGWALGLAWALLSWSVARVLRLRGRIEIPEATPPRERPRS